jgi:hypothetical protein
VISSDADDSILSLQLNRGKIYLLGAAGLDRIVYIALVYSSTNYGASIEDQAILALNKRQT